MTARFTLPQEEQGFVQPQGDLALLTSFGVPEAFEGYTYRGVILEEWVSYSRRKDPSLIVQSEKLKADVCKQDITTDLRGLLFHLCDVTRLAQRDPTLSSSCQQPHQVSLFNPLPYF